MSQLDHFDLTWAWTEPSNIGNFHSDSHVRGAWRVSRVFAGM